MWHGCRCWWKAVAIIRDFIISNPIIHHSARSIRYWNNNMQTGKKTHNGLVLDTERWNSYAHTESSLRAWWRQQPSLLSIHPHHASLSITGPVRRHHVSLVLRGDRPSLRLLWSRTLWWTAGSLNRHMRFGFAHLQVQDCGPIDQSSALVVETFQKKCSFYWHACQAGRGRWPRTRKLRSHSLYLSSAFVPYPPRCSQRHFSLK